ncbi:hypothetical protein SUGI_0660580 [Cryptomeria japonica]|uniref:F-box protein GID2 n=1 Tax=Cryptomeria japonica TaxID=3369 RepID=UPI002414CE4B|nr:F-box protein GID2 [Cryptomeria japonica]GLJ32805.1 hypothetical protein SUGI_0660580 [Cryptomeria japonica]
MHKGSSNNFVGSVGSIIIGLESKQEMKKMEEKGFYSVAVVDNVDAMHEIFKHLDAESLATASCVSRGWHQAAMDDALWELVCTKHWPASGISIGRLRSVVNVLGGFRRLYVKWMHPLCRNDAFKEDNVVWSEDQVQLSLSLFSVEYYGRLGNGPFYGSSGSTIPNSHFLCNFHGATAGTLSYV